jgi:hypothetical protein
MYTYYGTVLRYAGPVAPYRGLFIPTLRPTYIGFVPMFHVICRHDGSTRIQTPVYQVNDVRIRHRLPVPVPGSC